MHKHLTILGAFLLVAASAGAQSIIVSAEQERAARALETACDGAWSSFTQANLEGHLLRIDDARAAQANCFLKTLSTTTFYAYNPDLDQARVDSNVRLLLLAYMPSAYDHFADQLDVFPGRVQHGLLSTLLEVGDPKATRMYFAARRAHEQQVSADTPGYYRAMLAERCQRVRRCSPRLAESLAIVRANLDIVETELRATLMLTAPEGASAAELNHMAAVHREAAELIETVQKLRSTPVK